jgi:hypothetical protein
MNGLKIDLTVLQDESLQPRIQTVMVKMTMAQILGFGQTGDFIHHRESNIILNESVFCSLMKTSEQDHQSKFSFN